MQLLESFKETDSSGETLLQPAGNASLQKCVVSTQSYVYNEMNKLCSMNVPVKNYNYVDSFRQAKNKELTSSCIILCLLFFSILLIFYKSSRCKRKTH